MNLAAKQEPRSNFDRRAAAVSSPASVRRPMGFMVPLILFLLTAILVAKPLLTHDIPVTQGNDMANHVRHTFEYASALRAGQIPPTTTVGLQGGIWIPLFQYYSGTGYLLAGILTLILGSAYAGLAGSVIVHAALGAFALFRSLQAAFSSALAALLGALAFELYPFSATNLYSRGAFPEWLATNTLPIVLWAVIGVGLAANTRQRALRLAGLVAALVYFMPIHPVHTVYSLPLVMMLGALVVLLQPAANPPPTDRSSGPRRWLSLALWLAFAMATACAIDAWYLLPILTDYGNLQIHDQNNFLNAGITLHRLFYPFFLADPDIHFDWACQVGTHLVLGSLLLLTLPLVWGRAAAPRLGVLASLGFAACLVLVLFGPRWKWACLVFSPIQWNYRLLVPAAMMGVIGYTGCLAWCQRRHPRGFEAVVLPLCLAYTALLGYQYYLQAMDRFAQHGRYTIEPSEVLSPGFISPNAISYSFRGNDFRQMRDPRGFLIAGEKFLVPKDGLPFRFCLTVAPELGRRITATLDNQPLPLTYRQAHGVCLVSGEVPPLQKPGFADRHLGFDPHGLAIPIQDMTFSSPADRNAFRVAPSPVASSARERYQEYQINGQAGLYQIPVVYRPRMTVTVNQTPVAQASADRQMFVIPLNHGLNRVKFTPQRGLDFWLSVGGILVLLGLTGIGLAQAPPRNPARLH